MRIFKWTKISLALVVLVLTTGCSVLSVHRDADQVRGIPFYAKTLETRQTTTYLEDRYQVRIERLVVMLDPSSEKPRKVLSQTPLYDFKVWRPQLESDEMRKLRATAASSAEMDELVVALIEKASRMDCLPKRQYPDFSLSCFQLVENQLASNLVVDSTKTYYLNARHPLVGKGGVEFELGDDMTLTKGKAEVEDKTLETILSLIPLSEYLTAAFIPSADTLDFTVGGVVTEHLMTITSAPLIHKLSMNANTLGAPLDFARCLDSPVKCSGTSYSVAAPGSGSDKKPSSPGSYEIEATIKPSSSKKKE